MNKKIFFSLSLLIILTLQGLVRCIEPISTGLAITIAVAAAWKARCFVKECCTERWTNHNVTMLQKAFDKELFGQHLVKNVVFKAIKAHVRNKNPKKALVFSFHGWTGSGKNYVADLIAKHVYREGLSSQYVHKKIAPLHYPHNGNLEAYKQNLKEFIIKNTKLCSHSLFVFDEMDKMPVGLADVLKAFIDHHYDVDGIDFRNNIFIFLSNTAGDRINKATLEHFNSGKLREQITSKKMEQILSVASFNLNGGFKNSDLLLAGLVDFLIPFLPMEREHIKQCITAEIIKQKGVVTSVLVDKVAEELDYFPKGEGIFSTSGCKMVEKKLGLYI